jgi:hypothetical protein
MTDWLIDPPRDRLGFPRVRHRHPNGELPVDRDRTPSIVQALGEPPVERWTYACACGEVYLWDRPRPGAAGTEPTTPTPRVASEPQHD